jgi:predicted ArsR family transcriptional regulator
LTPKAHELFPRAYEPALRALLDVFVERFSDRVARDLLLRAGRRLLSERFGKLPGRSPRQRLAEVVTRLDGERVGVEVTDERGALVLQACSCPLASLTASRPEVCKLVAALLGGVLGTDARERCVRGDSPRCCFEVGTNGRAAKSRGST